MGLFDAISVGMEALKTFTESTTYEEREGKQKWADIQNRFSLSCKKCGGLAKPVRYTDRHYECSCGHKFTGTKHPNGDHSLEDEMDKLSSI